MSRRSNKANRKHLDTVARRQKQRWAIFFQHHGSLCRKRPEESLRRMIEDHALELLRKGFEG